MRTTVDIPDKMYRRLKSKAAMEGHSVKSLILTSVEKELGSAPEDRQRKSLNLPLVRSKKPGALRLTSEKIYEVIPFP